MTNPDDVAIRSTSNTASRPPSHLRTKSYTHVFPASSAKPSSSPPPTTAAHAKSQRTTNQKPPGAHSIAVSASNSNMFFNGLGWLLINTAEAKKPVSLEGDPLTENALRRLDKSTPESSVKEAVSDSSNATSAVSGDARQ